MNRSSLANRFLQLTHDAPLCAKVLGNFVYDESVEDAAQDHDLRPPTPDESNSLGGVFSSTLDGDESPS